MYSPIHQWGLTLQTQLARIGRLLFVRQSRLLTYTCLAFVRGQGLGAIQNLPTLVAMQPLLRKWYSHLDRMAHLGLPIVSIACRYQEEAESRAASSFLTDLASSITSSFIMSNMAA